MDHDLLYKVKLATLCMQRYSWEQGVCAQAFYESGDIREAIGLCYDAINRQSPDGRMANIGEQHGVTDPVAIVEVMLAAYQQTKDEAFKAALDSALDWALVRAPRSCRGIVYHVDNAPEFWVDSMYMLPPILLAAGYPDQGIAQADGYIGALYDSRAGLFSHQWDEEKQAFIRKDFWGVGNGWALAGLTRMIEGLSDEYQEAKERYGQLIAQTVDAALAYMTEEGMFHDVIDDPQTFKELNFGQMLCYTLYKGIKAGRISETYLEKADFIRAASHKRVSPYGLVEPVCGAPSFDKPGRAPEGQAFFILMETARAALL